MCVSLSLSSYTVDHLTGKCPGSGVRPLGCVAEQSWKVLVSCPSLLQLAWLITTIRRSTHRTYSTLQSTEYFKRQTLSKLGGLGCRGAARVPRASQREMPSVASDTDAGPRFSAAKHTAIQSSPPAQTPPAKPLGPRPIISCSPSPVSPRSISQSPWPRPPCPVLSPGLYHITRHP